MINVKTLLKSAQNPSDKEEIFTDYLLISPSYQLAHKLRTVGLTKEERRQQPKDFKKVLEVYDTCGDLISQSFDSWWDERGRDLLRTNQNRTDLIAYPVDLTASVTKLVKEFTEFVTQAKLTKKARISSIQILSNKIKVGALQAKLELINEKGRIEFRTGKRIEHWRLAIQTDLKSKWKSALTPTSGKTAANEQARTILGVLVSKHLKEALWIAENAARGVFPLAEPIETGLDFDFYTSFRLSSRMIGMSAKERNRKEQAGETVRKTYYERKVKPAINRQKTIEALVEARLKIERLNQS